MGVRRKIERKIREKENEIHELNLKLREGVAYLQALQDALKLIPRDEGDDENENGEEATVKPGSAIAEVLNVLKAHGKPMHIMEILPAIGREATPENRASVGSSIAAYVRKRQIFTRPAPNTFGLTEWAISSAGATDNEPPEGFGLAN